MKKIIAVVLAMCMVLGLCAACGKKAEAPQQGAGTPAALPAQQGGSGGSGSSGSTGSGSSGSTPEPAPVREDSQVLYMQFLNNAKDVSVDYGIEGLSQGSYYIADMAEAFRAYYSEQFQDYLLGDVYYAFIDCGNDGEPELALSISLIEPAGSEFNGPYEQMMVIKRMDDGLHVVAYCYSFYRTSSYINKYGYLSEGGSSSAMGYYYEDSFVNADGEHKFLFSIDTSMGMSEAVIPSYDLPDGVMPDDYEYGWDYDENGYEINVYNLSKYTGSYDDDEAYNEYLRGNFYVFYDNGGDNVMPLEDLMKLYEAAGIDVVTEDEAMDRLGKQFEAQGADSDLYSAEEAEWEYLDPEATNWQPKG